MNPSNCSRRSFIRTTALASTIAVPLLSKLTGRLEGASTPSSLASVPAIPAAPAASLTAPIRWLEGTAPDFSPGATWGVPWARGLHAKGTSFKLQSAGADSEIAVQTWPLAYWPDGSLKWTGHALPAGARPDENVTLVPGAPPRLTNPLGVTTSGDAFEIDTGTIHCTIARSGSVLISSVKRADSGVEILRNGRLVCLHQNAPTSDAADAGGTRQETFTGHIDTVTLEQDGPVRAVVKIEGRHASQSRTWLPFVLRLYFYAGGESFRVMHTIIYDGDESKDFIRGLGLRFDVPMQDELYNRHIRFSGQNNGLFGEAVRGLTGLRRDPGVNIRAAQFDGEEAGPGMSDVVRTRLDYIPAFSDWTLSQPNADSFVIRKRTRDGFSWLRSAQGTRAGGLGYVGTPKGGVAFGIRNFWQSHPAQFDIRGAATDSAEVTLWVWAPDAAPMDLRFYHDGMGLDTHEKQVDAMLITYEDYEPGFSRPEGVARTSEMHIFALAATPPRKRLAALSRAVSEPGVVATTPGHILGAGVFGALWSLPDSSSQIGAAIEDRLELYFQFYRQQVEERRWYGFWNYGDFMHSYDVDRHEWKYDIGGFAWDNSELSTEIWLWLYYLHTGRADVFRMAEAMTRHTGEVDVHHIGRFAGLGSRHNVQHWGCSGKQLRISTAQNRRYYYYLSADERVGDLLREQVESVRALVTTQAGRKRPDERPGVKDVQTVNNVFMSFGTDWSAVAAAWLTEWERTGSERIRDRLFASMRTIAAQPHGFFSLRSFINAETGEFQIRTASEPPQAEHLSAAFGLPEVCAELVELSAGYPVHESFTKAWLQYCILYNASDEEQKAVFGKSLGASGLAQGHSRLTAYAAWKQSDKRLAQRAWSEFYRGGSGMPWHTWPSDSLIEGDAVLRPVHEGIGMPTGTNGVAQWGLAGIVCLGLLGKPPEPVANDNDKRKRARGERKRDNE